MNKLFLGIILVFNFGSADVNGQKGPPSPDALINYDKAYEKYQRDLAEVQEKNKQITDSNQKINQALQDWFEARGVLHADDMSGALLEAYGAYLRGGAVNLDSIVAAVPPSDGSVPADS